MKHGPAEEGRFYMHVSSIPYMFLPVPASSFTGRPFWTRILDPALLCAQAQLSEVCWDSKFPNASPAGDYRQLQSPKLSVCAHL